MDSSGFYVCAFLILFKQRSRVSHEDCLVDLDLDLCRGLDLFFLSFFGLLVDLQVWLELKAFFTPTQVSPEDWRPGHTKRVLRCDFASHSVALVSRSICFNGVTTPRANSHRTCFLLRSAKNRDAIPHCARCGPGLRRNDCLRFFCVLARLNAWSRRFQQRKSVCEEKSSVSKRIRRWAAAKPSLCVWGGDLIT